MAKIILVDKSPLTGQAFEYVLKKNRPHFAFLGQAFSVKSGLELAEQTSPDIVFADILIPETDGLKMAAKLKELYPHIYIVILTIVDDFYLVEKALQIGVNDYLLKPLSYTSLLLTVDKLGVIINSTEFSPQPPESTSLSTFYKKLLKLIHAGRSRQIFDLTETILSELAISSKGDISQIRTQLITLTAEITSARQNTKVSHLLKIIYKQFLDDIIPAQNTEELCASFKKYVEKAAALFNQEERNYRFGIVSQIQEIIENRLHDNLTLENIASEMYFTPSYLSRLFKKETGKNFSDYLIDRRLEKAKVLLLSTDRTVDSIAEEIGYENANSFRRLFKSKVGMSATKYRAFDYQQKQTGLK